MLCVGADHICHARAPQVVHDLLGFLKPGGWVVMTMKFPGVGRDRSSVFASVCEVSRLTKPRARSKSHAVRTAVCARLWTTAPLAVACLRSCPHHPFPALSCTDMEH